MKKIALILMAVMIMCVGCGGNGSSSEKKHSFDAATLADELKNEIEYEDELNEGNDTIFFRKYNVSEDLVASQKTYFSTNATTEEISVIECKDEKAAEEVKKALEQRVEEQKQTFESYAPEEVARLDKAVIRILGKYAVLCVTADTDKANEIIDKY